MNDKDVWCDLAPECDKFTVFETYGKWHRSCWFCISFDPEYEKCEFTDKEEIRKRKMAAKHPDQRRLDEEWLSVEV